MPYLESGYVHTCLTILIVCALASQLIAQEPPNTTDRLVTIINPTGYFWTQSGSIQSGWTAAGESFIELNNNTTDSTITTDNNASFIIDNIDGIIQTQGTQGQPTTIRWRQLAPQDMTNQRLSWGLALREYRSMSLVVAPLARIVCPMQWGMVSIPAITPTSTGTIFIEVSGVSQQMTLTSGTYSLSINPPTPIVNMVSIPAGHLPNGPERYRYSGS